MKESVIHTELAIVSDDQSAKVSQPGKRPFDFPSTPVATERAAVVEGKRPAVFAMRTDQQYASIDQAPTQRIAVVAAIGDHSQGALLRSARSASRNADCIERGLGEGYFAGRRAGQLACQRNTLAVDHHHPLCALSTLGFADSVAPFLAGAKLPSRKLSSQSKRPRWSSSDRKARQMRSQTPCSSQRRSRFQQTLPLTPISRGMSRQRAPVLSTQRIPSSTTRLSFGGRPRLRRLSLGSNGSIFCHCVSESNRGRMTSFSQKLRPGTRQILPTHSLYFETEF